jgi:hypothetical protein
VKTLGTLFVRLLALLRPALRPGLRFGRAQRDAGRHRPISSYTRRYPGRTPAAELRRNLGWIAVTADRSHRDRRA